MTAATVVSPTRSSNTVESATTSTTLAGTTMSAASSTPTLPVGLSHYFGVKLPTYKSPGDVEIFVNRFEQFCITHGIDENSKANLLMDALDDVTFTVIKRELSDEERKNYKKTKEHLLRRFDLVKEGGQKRLIFRQTRRAAGQTFEDFYTQLLGLAAKAFPEEGDSKYVDRAITDQFVVGCDDDRVRLHLIEKAPSSSKEALQLALTFKAALQYNETLRDASSTIGAIQQQNYYRNDWRERQRDFNNDSRCEERNGRSRETQIKERNFEGNGDEERNERWRENREFQQVDRRPRSSSPAPNFIPSYRGNQQTANNNHRTRNNYSYEGNYTRNTYADMVALDSDLLQQTASHTVTMMHDTVISTLSHVYPFFAWIYRIIIITLILFFIALIIFISLECMKLINTKKRDQRIDNLIKSLHEPTTGTNV